MKLIRLSTTNYPYNARLISETVTVSVAGHFQMKRLLWCALLVLFAVVALTSAQEVEYPDDEEEAEERGSRFFVKKRMNYIEALEHCKVRNSRLVAIRTAEDSAFHFNQLKKEKVRRAWIAYNRRNDTVDEEPYTFMYEGYSRQMALKQFWGPKEPNNYKNHKERCVEVRVLTKNNATHNWNDRPCDHKNPFFCESI